jgi:hypothetical protein
VVAVVRQFAVDFLYKKSGASLVPEEESVERTMALAWAASGASGNAQLKRLSKIAVPFWLVQSSPESSILLAAIGSQVRKFSFTQETRMSEIRRAMSNEINEPKDVPPIVDKVLRLLDELETIEKPVQNLYSPSAIEEVGQHVRELEPGRDPNRFDQVFSSQSALAESEKFQAILKDVLARIDRMEELKQLVADQLRGQLRVLENIVAMEKKRWEDRFSAMKTSTEVATHDLQVQKSDKLYALREAYRKKLRAKTAEFARSSTDIESYFTYLLNHVREVRSDIAQKQDDIDSAVDEYNKLAKYLSDALPRFTEILEALNEKSREVLQDAKQFNETLASQTGKTEASVEDQIGEKQKRLEQLEQERKQNESELDSLIGQVGHSIERLEDRINKRIVDHQAEVLILRTSALKNESIPNIAPLTHLDVFVYLAKYSDGKLLVFTPGLTPVNRFRMPVEYRALSNGLHTFLKSVLDPLMTSDAAFRSRLDSAMSNGDITQEPETADMIDSGLRELQVRQLLEEGVNENIKRVLSLAMGK